eukprot:s2922_g7.t2
MAGRGGRGGAHSHVSLALQGLLGLVQRPLDDIQEHPGENYQSPRGEEMGRGPLWNQPPLSILLAGNPGRTDLGELDQEERVNSENHDKEHPFPPVPPMGGNLFGMWNTENTGDIKEQQGTFGRTWETMRGWMSPRKKPEEPPVVTRKDVPKLRQETKTETSKKDKLLKALGAARKLKQRGLKNPSIEKCFSAASSVESKNAKKRTIVKIFEVLAGNNPILPLNPEMLKGLASALQEGDYKAGEGYLIEAKLWHVEEGHSWSDTLDRTFKQCKRALARGRGPRKKAAEVPREARAHPNKLKFSQADKAVKFARELFVFCTAWMLREIELASLCTEDVMLDHLSKKVTLHLKLSKMDNEGKGVRRTLQCLCHGKVCDWECPYVLSKDVVEKVEQFNGTSSQLALTRNKKLATKGQIVNTWRWLFGPEVSGHSGRRTGALNYIRSGWSVAQVAHLGRWKSSAILSYAEEALEQMPANLHVPCQVLDTKGQQSIEQKFVSEDDMNNWKTLLKKEIAELKGEVREKGKENDELVNTWVKFYKDNPGSLPRKVRSLPAKVGERSVCGGCPDWGRRYVRAVFGRIRACGTLPEPDRTVYKESQNDCSPSDTASVETLVDRCSDIFLGFDVEQHLHLRNVTSFVQMLPLEWVGGCDGIYRGCDERTFPSGLAFDDGLLRCALRLDAGHVWVNQFGITERHALEKSSYMEELMGMSFTGMPLPPHLPWAPVIDPRGPKDLHYAVGGGLLTLPQKVLMEDESPLHLGSITAGFNRDEGTLFALLVPHFLGYVPRFTATEGMEDSVYRDIMEQLACPDYGVEVCQGVEKVILSHRLCVL